MTSKYKIGYYYERKTLQKLENEGYICWRTPGSHSPIDVIAIKNENGNLKVKLIQIKATSKENYKIDEFEKSRLSELKNILNHRDVNIEIWIYNRKARELKIEII